jgi:hypothetical protein
LEKILPVGAEGPNRPFGRGSIIFVYSSLKTPEGFFYILFLLLPSGAKIHAFGGDLSIRCDPDGSSKSSC